jgi:hypothetical protein
MVSGLENSVRGVDRPADFMKFDREKSPTMVDTRIKSGTGFDNVLDAYKAAAGVNDPTKPVDATSAPASTGTSTNDNGVTQTVEARQGVALNAMVEIKPRVMLRPFRTFLEVEQPESEFLLRVDPDEGIGFFEADGGIWKLEAKKNIADYFLKNMGDLIDAGKVVVMQ